MPMKSPLIGSVLCLAGRHIAQPQALHFFLFHAQHFFDDGVGAQDDLRVSLDAVEHDL